MMKSGLLIKIILTLLLLPALAWLTKAGVADFLRLSPCAYIDALNKGTVPLEPAELDKTRVRLKLARSWDASNPIIPEYLGQTDFMLAQLVSFSPAMQATFLHNAIVNLDSAIGLRPYSAYLWAARMTMGSWLLEINTQLGRNDPIDKSELTVIKMALRRAALLDPWNPAVLQQIVKLGTLRYMEFSAEDRSVVDEAVTRAKQLNIKI
ncbi:MAG: hypothetical protein Q7T38_00870 [Gallionella sp.]|nr:hypothetical protein [Gallionella sp.]